MEQPQRADHVVHVVDAAVVRLQRQAEQRARARRAARLVQPPVRDLYARRFTPADINGVTQRAGITPPRVMGRKSI